MLTIHKLNASVDASKNASVGMQGYRGISVSIRYDGLNAYTFNADEVQFTVGVTH